MNMTKGYKHGYVDANKLMIFANNHVDKKIDANDIARFHKAKVKPDIHALWIEHTRNDEINGERFDYPDEDFMTCSNCHHSFNYIDNCTEEFDYCPNCGAKMDGDEHDN